MVKKIKDSRSSSSSIKGRRSILVHSRSSTIVRPGSDSDCSMALLKEEAHSGDHFLTPAQLSIVYRTNTHTGLAESFARDLLDINGPNTLKEFTPPDYLKILCHNVFGWIQCSLWVTAVLTLCAYLMAEHLDPATHTPNTPEEYLYIGSTIALAVLATGLFGFYKEARNAMVMSGFEKMVPPVTYVMRDGEWKWIPTAFVVVGDIVEISAGQLVPADVRILTCTNFTSDMSALTGESVPVHHVVQCTHVNPLESKNMCFFCSPVLEGSARGVVVATGENTQIGRIAGLVTGLEKHQTPIAKEISHFIKIVCGVAFLFGFIFFIVTFSLQDDFILAFAYMLAIVLANVPVGLIITLTVCMTLASYRLKKRNCHAKTPHVVETLGSTSVICADKTGTLTCNQMTVSHLVANYEIFDNHNVTVPFQNVISKLTLVASLNLRAAFADHHEVIAMRKVLGDASEAAILRYMERIASTTQMQQANQKVAETFNDSENKYYVTVHELAETKSYILIMKGAPEIILEHCTHIETDSSKVDEMTPQTHRQLRAVFEKLSENMGERLIAYAASFLPLSQFPIGFEFNCKEPNFPINNLTFIGAISLIDAPRDGVDKYIGLCRSAGIKVIMVTGDHPMTALAISRQCGTITLPTAYDYAMENHVDIFDVPLHMKRMFKAAVITGDELRKMSPFELKAVLLCYEELTFARMSPQQKLSIVESYQGLDHIVAATGDGVNDSPALKKADIGIAMGITGTEICKQAADMILLDDNFASMVNGIEEGRRIFDNLKKTIAYTLTSNTPEMLPFLLYACFGMPLPLSLIMIIIINVGTDLLPAMSLAYESSEEDLMKRSPRRVDDRLVNSVLLFMAFFQIGLIEFCAGMLAYFVTFAQHGFFPGSLMFVRSHWDDDGVVVSDTLGRSWIYDSRKRVQRAAQTSYFVAVCWTQISNLIICKTRRISVWKRGMKNNVLNVSICVSVGVVLIVTYIPGCNDFLGTEPIAIANLFLPVPFMLLMILSDEKRRYIIRNNLSKWVEKETCY